MNSTRLFTVNPANFSPYGIFSDGFGAFRTQLELVDYNSCSVVAPTAAHQNSEAVSTPGARSAVKPLAVNIREAAEMIGVSPQTVQREIDRGSLRALKVGRQWRVRLSELNAYLERQERKARH